MRVASSLRTYLLVFTCLAAVPSQVLAQPAQPTTLPPGVNEKTYELLNLFGDVYERVKTDYVEEVEDEKLIESAINGMLTDLDPHSGYLNQKSFDEMQVQTKGEFGGLGIEVTMENGLVKVVSPIDDTPAYRAGVKSGDFISHIDDEQVLGLTLSEAVDKMRGPVGTDIKITILRESAPEPIKLTITRDLIKIQSVRARTEGDIGYLRITSFSEQTYKGVEEAVTKLKKDIPEMKGLVLDLRNNPGGLLDQAIAVSDGFLDHGEVVSTRERNPNNTKRYAAKTGELIPNIPMVVLINNGSASASEIVAGALQDHKRAVLMGTKSFGKGSVQTVIPLKDHGAMRLTTSRYYTPSGRSIQAKGIEPDIVVEQAKIKPLEVTNRQEADLPHSLKNDQDKDPPSPFRKQGEKDTGPKEGKEEEKDALRDGLGQTLKAEEDFQLARALDLLRGMAVYRSSASQ